MIETDQHKTCAMWAECGIQFRSNVVRAGGKVELHSHSYPHVSMVTSGWFACHVVAPGGATQDYQMAARGFKTGNSEFNPVGYKVLIPEGYMHTFTPIELDDVGEILCMWGEGTD